MNAGVRTADEHEIWMDDRLGHGARFLQPRFSVMKQVDAVEIKSLSATDPAPTGAAIYELRVS